MTTDPLRQRAKALGLYGLLAHWNEIDETSWLSTLVQWEEEEQIRRSLERRLKNARLGRFKAIDQFDWNWPTRCDRGAIEAVLTLDFMQEAANVILIGPNGIGKTMIAKNIAHQALIAGHTVLCAGAGQLLGDLTATESDPALRRRLRQYSAPDLLVVDEIGYLSYANRHADLLFELLNRRYEKEEHHHYDQQAVLPMARGLPKRRLHRIARRSARPSLRSHRDRRQVVPAQRSRRAFGA
jgi:DNA replication protein DnaC